MRPTSETRRDVSVPFPKSTTTTTTTSTSTVSPIPTHSLPSRRLSLNVPSARAQPLAVPQRHGSLYSHPRRDRDRASFGSGSASFSETQPRRPLGSSLSLWASRDQDTEAEAVLLDDEPELGAGAEDMGWLDTRADQMGGDEACVVKAGTGMEQAVEVRSTVPLGFLHSRGVAADKVKS